MFLKSTEEEMYPKTTVGKHGETERMLRFDSFPSPISTSHFGTQAEMSSKVRQLLIRLS